MSPLHAATSREALPESTRATAIRSHAKLPYSFAENRGQAHRDVGFLAQGRGYTLFLTSSEAVFRLRGDAPYRVRGERDSVLRLQLIGSRSKIAVSGEARLPGRIHYFRGNDPARWQRDVPTYARVRYEEVYNGVDMVYYGAEGELEFDFVVAPGADPEEIRFGLRGPDAVTVDGEGRLLLTMSHREMVIKAPVVYQAALDGSGERTEIAGAFELHNGNEISFKLGAYDRRRELIIDPVLEYSSYLGGSDQDKADGIAVDSERNAYVTGITASVDFPTEGPIQGAIAGPQSDAFVTKISADGSTLIYSTYLGGENSGDQGFDIAVDEDGYAYVVGATNSSDFPTTPNAVQSEFGGQTDAFVACISPTGNSLVYSTFLGGARTDQGFGIALDSQKYAYITGRTSSNEYPVTAGAFQPDHSVTVAAFDAFVTKLNTSGGPLMYSTYLGGSDDSDQGNSIAVDASGYAYVGGATESDDFPVTPGIFQTMLRGGSDAFITKVNTDGSDLMYSTYLGGDNVDQGYALTIDFANDAYITGQTASRDFPTTPGAFLIEKQGTQPDSFVTKLNATGTELVYSTYLGGAGVDQAHGIAVDHGLKAYVTGWTTADNFPTVEPLDATESDGEAFYVVLNHLGSAPVFSTLLGGEESERVGDTGGAAGGNHIAIDDQCKIYGVGFTESSDFPTMGPFQESLGGEEDGFIAKIDPIVIDGQPAIGCEAVVVAPLVPLIKKISPNTLFTIFGRDFAAPGTSFNGGTLTKEGRLSTLFANTCIEVAGQRSPMFQVLTTQASAQAPHDLVVNDYVPVSLIRGCGTKEEVASPPEYVRVEASSPEFFVHLLGSTFDEEGNGLIIAQQLPDYGLIGDPATLPGAVGGAIPGTYAVLYGTGWGLTNPAVQAGEVATVAAEVPGERSIRIGDVEVPPEDIAYIGLTPGAVALYQVVFRIPPGLAPGVYRVVVTVNGVSTPLGPYLVVGAA